MKRLLLFFLGGLCIGTVMANFMQLGPLQTYVNYSDSISYINKRELFWFVLGKRNLHLLIIWLLSFTVFCRPVLYGYSLYYGFTTGTMISMLTMDLGLKSMIAYVGFLFPHILIYLPVGIFFAFKCLHEGVKFRQADIYGRKKALRPMVLRWALMFAAVVAIFAIGAFLEAFVNPWILQKVFKMM